MPALPPTLKAAEDLVFTGEEISVIDNAGGNWQLVSGTTVATNAGDYSFIIEPANGLKWKDNNGTEPRTFNWSIGTATVVAPVAQSFTYDGSLKQGVVSNAQYVLSDEISATEVKVSGGAVADYRVTATLNNVPGAAVPNCKWDDGTSASKTYTWRINPKEVAKPTAVSGLIYNGGPQDGFAHSADATRYELSGETNKTDFGSYTWTATLKDARNTQWSGSAYGVADFDADWSIGSLSVAKPVALATEFEYSGDEKVAIVTNGYPYCTITGTIAATNAAAYSFTAALNNPSATVKNYVWSDAGGIDNVTIDWTITPRKVKPPVARSGLKYTGVTQTGIDDSEDVAFYTHTTASWTNGVAAKTFYAYVQLKDTANFCWQDGSTAQLSVPWTIAKADNQIKSLKLGSWKQGQTPATPSVQALWGGNTVQYTYGETEEGPDWSGLCPTNVGIHYVRAVIPEGDNWLGAEAVKKFSIYSEPNDLFRDHVDIRVQGYTGTEALTNFPLLVRIDEKRFRGFLYSRAGATGEELTFTNEQGEPLPYEVDTWNPDGESLVWVRLNVMTNNATVTMYWALKPDALAPGYTPEDVWTDYYGVWHFNETVGSNYTLPAHDSTGNGYEAHPSCTATGSSISRMTTYLYGQVGTGRTIESSNRLGCYFCLSNTVSLVTGGKMTFSGWVNLVGISSDLTKDQSRVFPIARKNKYSDDGGWAASYYRTASSATDLRQLSVFGSSSATMNGAISSGSLKGAWCYQAFSCDDTKVSIAGANPSKDASLNYNERANAISPITDNGLPITFGNSSCGTNTTYNSLYGSIDEYRLAREVRSKVWLEAEYNTAQDKNFCTNSLVVRDGLKVNYWLDYPKFAPRQLSIGDTPSLIYNGRLAEGTTITNYVTIGSTVTTNSVLPTAEGSYRVAFNMADPTGYELLESEKGIFDFIIVGTTPYEKIAGTSGENGRVLLMNRDTDTRCPINYQGYSERTATTSTFWQFLGDEVVNNNSTVIYNTKPGAESILWTTQYGRRLWHLVDCRHGNTITTDVADNPTYYGVQNYLPWSSTSRSILSRNYTTTPSTVGQLVMRNTTEAAVYSSCFDDGVGAIYFDAVNGWNNDSAAGYYKIRVDVCTNAVGWSAELRPPTDENIQSVMVTTNTTMEGEEIVTVTNFYANADWKPATMIPFVRDSTSESAPFTRQGNTQELMLNVRNGGTTRNFYRIVVPLQYRGPIRFRIRRTSANTSTGKGKDESFLLLDNIIASYPTMSADLKPTGWYDPEKGGKRTLGTELATTVPFPAISDTGVIGRAEPTYYVNAGMAADSNNFVIAANLHYRWRYLRQSADPTTSSTMLNPDSSAYYNSSYWHVAPLNPKNGFKTIEPLIFPAAVGDIEFWYELTMNTPHYQYVDYTGLNLGVPYDETCSAITNHMTAAERESDLLATTGKDWFVRLREGKSDYEQMFVKLDGPLAGEYPMELVEDHMWRGLVVIPPEAEGTCNFTFVGRNRQTPGSTEFDLNETYFGSAEGSTTGVPGSGTLTQSALAAQAVKLKLTVDHATSYYEFKMSDQFLTWGLSRAEYQNFNHWNDVWTPKSSGKFSVFTNGVDDVVMHTENLDAAGWKRYTSDDDNWNEPFYLVNYFTPDFPKEVFFQNHGTPNAWNGQNLTFVSEKLVAYVDTTKGADTATGMAAKLLGQGDGTLDFVKDNAPPGIEKVGFQARIGQTISMDTICFDSSSLFKYSSMGSIPIPSFNQNYLFLAPVMMSSKCGTASSANNYAGVDNNGAYDMAVGASVSVVAYYFPNVGCYEFRITRTTTGTAYLMELYRWSMDNGKIEPHLLCSWRDTNEGPQLWTNDERSYTSYQDANHANKYNPRYYGMFISVENTTSGTKIVAGASRNPFLPLTAAGLYNPCNGSNLNGYRGLKYIDNDSAKLTYGGYGVAAKDCPAQFVTMRSYPHPLKGIKNATTGAYSGDPASLTKLIDNKAWYYRANNNTQLVLADESEDTPQYAVDSLDGNYWSTSGRMNVFTNTASIIVGDMFRRYHGLKMPTDLKQDAILQLRKKGTADWVEYGRKQVSGYAFSSAELPLHVLGQYDVRLTTGADNVDVVIDDITQTKWQANDYEDLTFGDEEFVYTQGIVVTNTTRRKQEVILQPSRAIATKPISVRSPLLTGLGKISFTYADADANAEVWLQMATNQVSGNINALNASVKFGDGSQVDEWQTIAKYAGQSRSGYDGKLVTGSGATGGFTIYKGLHDRHDNPLQGLFRIFVPTGIVHTAVAKALKSNDTDYGKITITGVTVTDEPALSERAWRGWNLRTIGDKTDEEQRMNLCDTTLDGDVGNGLVCALNNSKNDVIGDEEKLVTGRPAVYSPTFGRIAGYKSGVGSVSFRARLYNTNGRASTPNGGLISIWGSKKDSIDGPWELITTFPVTDSVFHRFLWEAGKEVYLAIKFEISDPSTITGSPTYDRVILDEITICEKVQPSVGFAYARPFRQSLMEPVEITDILSPDEQPLAGESWGVQAKVAIRQLADEIDTENGFRVFFSYFQGEKPWGYEQWKKEAKAVKMIELVQVGDASNLVFRSVGDRPESLVSPVGKGGETVQFQLIVKYRDRGGVEYEQPIETYGEWEQPAWFYPVDKNVANHGDVDYTLFSPYTLLDTVSPGRAWINEVNWNDGMASEPGNNNVLPTTNQFIEICVPSGVDMSDWCLRAVDLNFKTQTLARIGKNGLPKEKISARPSNGYSFYVIESPWTQHEGGIRDVDGNVAADGAWVASTLSTMSDGTSGGTLGNANPFQFELVRPSGVIEHQFVLEGTNRWAKYDFGSDYDGSNLCARLQAKDHSPKRFYAGSEVSRRKAPNSSEYGSAGVIGGKADGDPAPGELPTWDRGLKFTPGDLNEGQEIPLGWFLAPNGTNAWVYFSIDGVHITQEVGGDTSRSAVAVVPIGKSTNVTYNVAGWYELAVTERQGDPTAEGVVTASGKRGTYVHTIAPTNTMVYVTAAESPNPELKSEFGLDESNPYTPAALKWLERNWPDSNAEDIRLARFKGLGASDAEIPISLTDMYWLDIPPVPESPEEFASESGGSNWWVRGALNIIPGDHVITKTYGKKMTFTNKVVEVTAYISNSVTHEAHAPFRLQGLGGEQSDTFTGNWTSETFKVRSKLDLSDDLDFLPFRKFVFDTHSFRGGDDPDKPFTATIEILDPFSSRSPGYSYGWYLHPEKRNSGYYKTTLDGEEFPFSTEWLKADDTYTSDP